MSITSPLTDHEKNQLVAILGGPSVARQIIAGTKPTLDTFPTFVELVVGGVAYQSKAQIIEQLDAKGSLLDLLTREVLRSPDYALTVRGQHLKLVAVSPWELGMLRGGSYSDVVAVAASRQLALCPVETAALASLQLCGRWTKHSRLVVASRPIKHNDIPYLFAVNSTQLWTVAGHQTQAWEPYDYFLFWRQ